MGLTLMFSFNSRLIADAPGQLNPAWNPAPNNPCHAFPLQISSRRYTANRLEEAKNHTTETLASVPSVPRGLFPVSQVFPRHFGKAGAPDMGAFFPPLRV